MERKYISLDVEATGPVPENYSLLSVGACVVGERNKQFYAELKPLTYYGYPASFDHEAMKVGCLGLRCLEDLSSDICHPSSKNFNPKKVLELLEIRGRDCKESMQDLNNWALDISKGFEPVLLTDVQPFDGSFVLWYFSNFEVKHPFGHKGVNIDVLYRGITGNMDSNLRDLGIKDDRKTPHNSLDDAVFQAKLAEKVLSFMKRT